jgi:hypothetical protein
MFPLERHCPPSWSAPGKSFVAIERPQVDCVDLIATHTAKKKGRLAA